MLKMKTPERRPPVSAMDPADIEIGHRLRPVSEAGVASVMASIEVLGHITDALQVRRIPAKGDRPARHVLAAGAHRLEAAKRLGMTTVPVQVWDCSDSYAMFLEIDDNLAGAKMCALDEALFLARRKALYEREFPQAVRGGDRRSVAFADQTDIVSFCSATAEAIGKSERQVRRMMQGAHVLAPDEVARLRQAPRRITSSDLQVIAKISEATARYAVVAALAEGRAKSAADALAQMKGPKPQRDPNSAAQEKIAAVWSRLPLAAKRAFAADHADELRRLLADPEQP